MMTSENQELKDHEDYLKKHEDLCINESKTTQNNSSFISAILSVLTVAYFLMILFFGSDEPNSKFSIVSIVAYSLICLANVFLQKNRIKNFIILEYCLSLACIVQLIICTIYTYARIHAETALDIIRSLEHFIGLVAPSTYPKIYYIFILISAIIIGMFIKRIKDINSRSKKTIITLRLVSIVFAIIAIITDFALLIHYSSDYYY